jgi:HEAT repeat protein
MNAAEEELVLELAAESISPQEFLRQFRNSEDGVVLTGQLLEEALASGRGDDAEMALLVGFSFGFAPEHLQALIALEPADWHHRHENVVLALDALRSPAAVEALLHATQWIPDYLEFDFNRALAVKAIWALGKIDSEDATAALVQIAQDPEPLLAECAAKQLHRRQAG